VTAPAFLGVERSLSGRRWLARGENSRVAEALAQRLALPEVVARLLAARGVTTETAARFLNPALRDWLPDPSRLKDMDRAVARLVRAIEGGERIAVFGDYDVDGATSAALLQRFFAAVGTSIRVYVPDRLTEGYGPNGPALKKLRDEGIDVVVTVDCGITAFAALEEARGVGLDVIVVDHHVAEPKLPAAAAVVDPNRLDEDDEVREACGRLAAVGVAFLLAVGVNRALRQAGWYGAARPEPDLLGWLDLVALGTVCDVVPLLGLNRAFVTQGLKVMARRSNPGLTALADQARLKEPPGAWHAGFVLGPRVNAGGRVGDAGLGARLLATNDPVEAAAIALRLDELNQERRAIEQVALEQAMRQVEESSDGALAFVVGQGWHPGVIGIVAGRLRERYDRPACVVTLWREAGGGEMGGEMGGEIGKGSGRSVPGVDLGSAIIAARQAGLLVNGGGHAMAAGFTVEPARIGELREFLSRRLAALVPAGPVVPVLEIDGALSPEAASIELAAQVAALGPFGSGNEEPRFAVAAARVVRATQVGAEHVSCILAGPGGGRLKAIAFRAFERDLGRMLMRSNGAALHLAGTLRLNTWQGRGEAQLVIEDGAVAS